MLSLSITILVACPTAALAAPGSGMDGQWVAESLAPLVPAAAAQNWPSFRGPKASGVADGQNLPEKFGGETAENVRWKTRIPGLAHSSPIVWGDRVFLTTAVSSRGPASFKPGLYGAGDASDDRGAQQWKVLCLNKRDGRVLWERTAFDGVPREKRHIKATYANATPATDGNTVVAFFGSQGLHAYQVDGKPMWERNLGVLDAGAYDAPDYEWGTASSPIIYKDRVIVQCDVQPKGARKQAPGDDRPTSFLAAFDLKTGKPLWRAERDELPSWGTPNVYEGAGGIELVTNASNFIRGYDPASGQEIWRLGGSSKITTPTPVFADGLIVVASGRRPEAPIFVIRAGARGDISLKDGATSNAHVTWSRMQRGSYMPTPLIYQGLLYVLNNNGIFDCYDLKSGEEVYRERITHRGLGFSASPVAADGRIYISGEDGDVFVVKAGRKFELNATHAMGEPLMATPALSDGTLILRGQNHVFAVSR